MVGIDRTHPQGLDDGHGPREAGPDPTTYTYSYQPL
jgi:hypothetical protein